MLFKIVTSGLLTRNSRVTSFSH